MSICAAGIACQQCDFVDALKEMQSQRADIIGVPKVCTIFLEKCSRRLQWNLQDWFYHTKDHKIDFNSCPASRWYHKVIGGAYCWV